MGESSEPAKVAATPEPAAGTRFAEGSEQLAADTIAIAPPRRLRLDELLRELGAREKSDTSTEERAEGITVGELVDKAAEAGFGFLVGILALIAIPFVGLSTPFGLAIAIIGGQMMLGRTRPWLPHRFRRRALRMTMLDRVLGLLTRRTRWLARSTKQRWEAAIQPRAVGLGIVLLALGLALPLPIPGSNLVFLVPLFVYAVGLLERDGVWIALGHLSIVVHTVLVIVFSKTIVLVFEQIASWFG